MPQQSDPVSECHSLRGELAPAVPAARGTWAAFAFCLGPPTPRGTAAAWGRGRTSHSRRHS